MKYILCLFSFLMIVNMAACQNNELKPVKIHSIDIEQKSGAFYIQQAKLWKNVVDKTPTNAGAWLNYYIATRYSRIFGQVKNSAEKEVMAAVAKAVPNSFENHLIQHWGSKWNAKEHKHLEKAYEIDPDRPETYRALARNAELKRDLPTVKKFMTKVYESEYYSRTVLAWNYNLLQSVSENGILLTYGDNDTYPAMMLQHAKGIRTDVLLLNIHLLRDIEYANRVFKELGMPAFKGTTADSDLQVNLVNHFLENTDRTLHFSTTTSPQLRASFEDNLYLTGLTHQYCKNQFDNIAVIKNNYNHKFALDYITKPISFDRGQGMVDQMNMAYVASLFLLYNHYDKSGDKTDAESVKKLILLIGKANGKEADFQSYFKH